MVGLSTPHTPSRRYNQWNRIVSMDVPGRRLSPSPLNNRRCGLQQTEAATICLANPLRPGRIHVDVPVRQDDLNLMIPEDWRRLQQEGVRPHARLPVKQAVWNRIARDRIDADRDTASTGPRPLDATHSLSGTISPESAGPSQSAHPHFSASNSPRQESCEEPDDGSCSSPTHSPALGDEMYDADHEEGNSSWEEDDTQPSTPASQLPGWLDDLHQLMGRHSVTSTESDQVVPKLAPPTNSHRGREGQGGGGGTFLPLVEAEGPECDADADLDSPDEHRPVRRKTSRVPSFNLQPTEERDESQDGDISDGPCSIDENDGLASQHEASASSRSPLVTITAA